MEHSPINRERQQDPPWRRRRLAALPDPSPPTMALRRRRLAARCPTKELNTALFGNDMQLRCLEASEYSFFVVSTYPTMDEIRKMCTSTNCKDTVTLIESLVPKECEVAAGVALYENIINPIKSQCQWSSQASTHDPKGIPSEKVAMDPDISSAADQNASSSNTGGIREVVARDHRDSRGGMDSATIIGMVTGGVVCILIAGYLSVHIRRRRRRHRSPKYDQQSSSCETSEDDAHNPEFEYSDLVPTPTLSFATRKSSLHHRVSLRQSSSSGSFWDDPLLAASRVDMRDVEIGELLHRENGHDVFRGRYHSERIAIRRLTAENRGDHDGKTEHLHYVRMLASLDHERVLRLVGVAWQTHSDLWILTEFMEHGTLRSLLSRMQSQACPKGFTLDKVKIALHIIHALAYLHSIDPEPMVHGMLTSDKVLVSETYDAKLHGIALIEKSSQPRTRSETLRWMAPEVVRGEPVGCEADIFSFGVILTELDSHTLPYTGRSPSGCWEEPDLGTLVEQIAKDSISLKFSDAADPDIVSLGQACIAVDPRNRPSARDLHARLEQIIKTYGGLV